MKRTTGSLLTLSGKIISIKEIKISKEKPWFNHQKIKWKIDGKRVPNKRVCAVVYKKLELPQILDRDDPGMIMRSLNELFQL